MYREDDLLKINMSIQKKKINETKGSHISKSAAKRLENAASRWVHDCLN